MIIKILFCIHETVLKISKHGLGQETTKNAEIEGPTMAPNLQQVQQRRPTQIHRSRTFPTDASPMISTLNR